MQFNQYTHTHTHTPRRGAHQVEYNGKDDRVGLRGYVGVVGVSHIQRICCQPEKNVLHGGQSRSWSAEQRKENKKRKSRSATPPSLYAARYELAFDDFCNFRQLCALMCVCV